MWVHNKTAISILVGSLNRVIGPRSDFFVEPRIICLSMGDRTQLVEGYLSHDSCSVGQLLQRQ